MTKHIRICTLILAILACQLAAFGADKVSARTEKAIIPTFDIGRGRPTPSIFEEDRAAAYPMATFDISKRSEKPVDREYEMSVLENEYLRVEVLSEIGGRVWRIIDKKANRNLLWTNDAIKPVSVGRRSGWIAGGIEFPFPVGNHGEDTISPYRSSIRENPDGSATVTVSSFDHYYRFWGSYDMTLTPGDSRLAITVRMYNPTLVRNRYQLWVNAAVPAGNDMQFIFPVEYVSGHGFGGVHPWPMWDDGKSDRSFWKNQRGQLGVFGWNADFFGAYYHDSDYGIIRYCPHTLAEGIKLWTWGTDSHWTAEYSINQGPYCEIQSGRWPTQEMYGWLEPHQMDTYTEYWYPVRGLKGVSEASKDAAMSCSINSADATLTSADVRLTALRPVKGKLTIAVAGKPLVSKPMSLVPGDLVMESVSLTGAGADDRIQVDLRDEEGFVVLSYDKAIAPKASPKPETPSSIKAEGDTRESDELASGLAAELDLGDPSNARDSYQGLVKASPDFAPAWKALGILLYKQADSPGAEEALSKAVKLAPEDAEAKYYLGLVKLSLGRADAIDVLKSITGDIRFAHVAKFSIGLEALKSGDFKGAMETFKAAGNGWSNDPILWDYLALAARLAGDGTAASEAIGAALSAEPLDPFAMVERLVAAGGASAEAVQAALGTDDDLYLEAALSYDAVNQSSTALDIAKAGESKASSGLYYCHLARLARRAGNEASAKEYAAKADSMGADYVFPHRSEDLAALDTVAGLDGKGGLPEFYRGTLLYWLGRRDDALGIWQGLVGRYRLPGLERRVADAYSRGRLRRDRDASIEMYQKALEADPNDIGVYYTLDDLYDVRDNQRRSELLEKGRKLFPDDDQLLLRMALFLVNRHRAAEAADLIEGHKFHKAHQSYELMHLGVRAIEETYSTLAADAKREGDNEKALKCLDKASRARETARDWFD